jgi:Ca2+-binding RTX toxin-like protein
MTTFTDGTGFLWDNTDYGNNNPRYAGATIDNGTRDAYDGGQFLAINGTYVAGGFGALELGGRQDVYSGAFGDISVVRRTYVPTAAGEGWARFLESFTNSGTVSQTFTVKIVSNSGADNGFTIIATSSGDTALTASDYYYVSDDRDEGIAEGEGDPAVLELYGDGSFPISGLTKDLYGGEDIDNQGYTFTITLAAGETKSILHFASQQTTLAAITEQLPTLERPDAVALFGLTDAQLASVLNFRLGTNTTPAPAGGNNGTGSGGTFIPGAFYGTEGPDTIIARTPDAILIGNGGNDTYLVNGSTDQVIEIAGGGTDIVYTTVSYNLGVNEVEALSTVQQTDTTAINLIGNFYSQTIVGNYGNNVLSGGGGADTLIGLFGNDTYAIGDSRIVVQEQAGQGNDTLVTSVDYRLSAGVSIETFAAQDASSTTGLRLTGNELAQTIAGTAGSDTIGGGGGRDVLIGGAGADTFLIGTVAAGNVAVLADFASGTDRIGLTSTAFNVGTSLDAAEFVAGTAATTADQRVIYDAGTGQLFYDADGNGTGAAVLFAQVVPGTAITAASFDVVVPTATTA